jgi:hypothetical protein
VVWSYEGKYVRSRVKEDEILDLVSCEDKGTCNSGASHLFPVAVCNWNILGKFYNQEQFSAFEKYLLTLTVANFEMPPGCAGKASFASSPRRPNGALNF